MHNTRKRGNLFHPPLLQLNMKKFLLICVFLEDDGTFNSFNYSLNNGFLVIDAVKIYPYTFLQGLENYFEIQEETEIFYEISYDDNNYAVIIGFSMIYSFLTILALPS